MKIVSGHAPADMREAFRDAVDAYEAWQDGQPEPVVTYGDGEVAIGRVCGLLWNCTDTLPVLYVTAVAGLQRWTDNPLRQGASYAQAARIMKSLIEHETDKLAA